MYADFYVQLWHFHKIYADNNIYRNTAHAIVLRPSR